MDEPYRTVLGHFRHEIGHYYCELLALTSDRREEFRALFGDETTRTRRHCSHYSTGSGRDWQDNFISAYATMHPFEDFAEVFGHFLHIVDTLTAEEFGSSQTSPRPLEAPMAEVAARLRCR